MSGYAQDERGYVPPMPMRTATKGRFVTWWKRRHGLEMNPLTGNWVRLGWPAEMAAMMARHVESWETHGGTCIDCQLPMRLHPRDRVWQRDERFYDVARGRVGQQ